MRSLIPARVAVFNREPFCYVTENNFGHQRMNGIGILIDYTKLLMQIRFNLTFVPINDMDIGHNDDGNYTGLFGLVQSNQADMSLVFAPLDLVDPPGNLGPVVMSFTYRIYSAVKLSSTSLSLGQCFAVFDRFTILLSFVVAILLGALACQSRLRNGLWWTFGVTTKQACRIDSSSNYKIWVGFLTMFILLIYAFFGASYTTDVSTEKPPKRVNTLQDLMDENRKPIWFRGDSTFMYFKHGVTDEQKRIWLKAQETGLNDCFIDYNSAMSLLSQGSNLLKLDESFIGVEYIERAARPHMCNSMWETRKNDLRLFESKPFASSNQVILTTKNGTNELGNRVTDISERIIENGLFRDSIDRLSYQTSPTPADSNCIRNIGKVERKDSVVTPMTFDLLRSVLIIGVIIGICSAFVLIIENLIFTL